MKDFLIKYKNIIIVVIVGMAVISLFSYQKKEMIKKLSLEISSMKKHSEESEALFIKKEESYKQQISKLKSTISNMKKKESSQTKKTERIVINADGSKVIERSSDNSTNKETEKYTAKNESINSNTDKNSSEEINSKKNKNNTEQSDQSKKTEELKITEESRGTNIMSILWFVGGFLLKTALTGIPF